MESVDGANSGARPVPLARDPHSPGYVTATELPDGAVPPVDIDGNFILSRIWLEVGDCDLLNPNVMRAHLHDWVLVNERMAATLAAKGYHYQFITARNAGHVDGAVKRQTLPEALEWLWHGYQP